MSYPKISLPQMLEETAERFPRQTALIYFSNRISYTQLLDHVNRCAAGLQSLGVNPGDRVALMLPNCPQFVIAYFGALRAGAIVTATSPIYTAREAGHQWHDAGVETVIVERCLQRIVKKARADLPALKNVIVTGLRDYYPKNFTKLCCSLGSKFKVQASKLKISPAHPASRIPHQVSGIQTRPWLDLLRVARRPRLITIKPADVA